MLKIHQSYPTGLRIESKFSPRASRLTRIWLCLLPLHTSSYSLPCSFPPSPASSLADLTGAFLPWMNLLLPLPEKPHHSSQIKAPKRELGSHAKYAPLFSLHSKLPKNRTVSLSIFCSLHQNLSSPNPTQGPHLSCSSKAQHIAYHKGDTQFSFNEENEPTTHCSWPQILLKSSLTSLSLNQFSHTLQGTHLKRQEIK